MIGLRYDPHAAVLGVFKDTRALQVGVAQLRVAHVADVQDPVPHVPQGPGWGRLWGWCPGLQPCGTFSGTWGTQGSTQSRRDLWSGAWLRRIQQGPVSTQEGPQSRTGAEVKRQGEF